MSNTEQLSDSVVTELMQKIAEAYEQRCEQQKQRSQLLSLVLSQLNKLNKQQRIDILEYVSEHFPANELSEAYVRQAASVGAALHAAASFSECLTRATRRRQLSGFRNELELNGKARGYRFVNALGMKHPKPLTKPKPIERLELNQPAVLKPTNGSSSNGIYILSGDRITEVKTGENLPSEQALRERIDELLDTNVIRNNRWVLEEYIGDDVDGRPVPARDLKFYCFYGELGFVLEVDREHGGHYCEWMPDMTLAKTGRYQNKTFEGKGFTQQQAQQALAVSSAIPAPFMRIDFLRSENQFVFGEFTPRPGQYNAFNAQFDRYLGEHYLRAEARLQQDLIAGKSFDVFNKTVAKK